jgi:phosphoglycerate dehydrogenase-like enzyme
VLVEENNNFATAHIAATTQISKENATNLMLQEICHKNFKNCAVEKVISLGNDPNTKQIFSSCYIQ